MRNFIRWTLFVVIFNLASISGIASTLENELNSETPSIGIQTVGIVSPTSTDEFKFGDQVSIIWENTDLGSNDRFSISYSVDGVNFVTIASPFHSQLTNSSSQSTYTWTVPDFGTSLDNQMRIKVENTTQTLSDTSEVFRVYFEPELKIGKPTIDDQFKFGEQVTISWKNQDLGSNDRFSIAYSVDEGSFITIASPFHSQLTNADDSSTYQWVLPDFGTFLDSQVKIRVLNSSRNVADTSEAFRAYFEPGLKIGKPTIDDQFKFGEQVTISWKNEDLGSNDRFSIAYSVDEGSFITIASPFHSQLINADDSSTYQWILPDFGTFLDSQVKIRVLNSSRNIADTSEAFRAYFEPELKIGKPTIDDQFKFGQQVTISWKNEDLGSNDRFSIAYSVDEGSFITIASPFHSQLTNADDSSTYQWILPDFGTFLDSQVKIRVLNSSRNVADTSEAFRAYFEPELKIGKPTIDDQFKFGQQVTISWKNEDLGSNDRFSIAYSVDEGSFITIASPFHSQLTNADDSSTYQWILPDFGTFLDSQVKIRVLNSSRNVADTSEAFRAYFEPMVDLEIPDSTDQFKFLEQVTISWKNEDLGSNDRFSIAYSVDAGNFVTIASPFHSQLSNEGNQSSYTWNIPDFGSSLDNDLRIRVLNSSRNVDDTTQIFRVYFEPNVEMIAPQKGKNLLQNTTQEISWENSDLGINDRFSIYYSVNDGPYASLSNLFHSQLSNDGSISKYNWNVPAIESTQVKVAVVNTSRNQSDTTDFFTLCSSCPTIALFSPNGGEQLRVGATSVVAWTLGEAWVGTDDIVVDYSLDGGTTYEADKIYDGKYESIVDNKIEWSIPDQLTTTARVRVTNVTQTLSDESDQDFTILPALVPSITLIKPNGGETLTGGQFFNIRWTSENIASTDEVEISLSEDGGISYTEITSGTSATLNGLFTWSIPNTTTTEAKIRVTNVTQSISSESENLFTIEAPLPTITLLQPNGGETLFVGSNYTITWTSGNMADSDDISVELSADGGDIFEEIASGTLSELNGRLVWIVPDRATEQARIRVTNETEGISSTSEANFIIAQPLIPAIALTQPNGGEMLDEGQLFDINWTSENFSTSDLIDIQHSTDGGETYTTITEGVSGSFNGTYRWSVPELAGDQNIIRVENITKDVFDESDNTFTISPVASITITSPNGGEVLTGGEQFTIVWTSENLAIEDEIIIELTTNGTASYSEIARGSFDGTFLWEVPNTPAANVAVRVRTESGSASDVNNQFFSIRATPSITITTPNGGEFWETGTQQVIRWSTQSFDASDLINIQLSTDNGETFTTISEGFNNIYNGQFSYEAPAITTTGAYIKVVNTTKEIEDQNDEPFSIGTLTRSLTLTAPNGGETWVVGERGDISWVGENMASSDVIRFEISLDGGDSYTQIGGNTTFGNYPNNETFYTIPDTPSDIVLFRLTNVTQSISDISDEVFTIVNTAAPIWQAFAGNIIGDDLDLSYTLNEESTIYAVVLPFDAASPSNVEVKTAAGGTSIADQVLTEQIDYSTPGVSASAGFTASFVRDDFYDIYLVAEDVDGNLGDVRLINNVLAQFTLSEQDSLALDQIYDKLNGDAWENTQDDWKSLAVADKNEVTLNEEGRIIALDLSNKAIQGNLPVDILNLTELTSLDISENAFEGLVSLNSLESLSSLFVGNNQLDFADLLPVSSFFSNETDYSPQAQITATRSDTIPQGSRITISLFTSGAGNSYDWRLTNDLVTNEVVTQATTNSYLISSLDYNNMGVYSATITNTALPALTLETGPIVMLASATISGLINGTDGNPLPTGELELFKIGENGRGYDTVATEVQVVEGAFNIPEVVLGDYLSITDSEVKNAENNKAYLPTYYKATDLWQEADTIILRADVELNDYTIQNMPPILTEDDGEGTVDGIVESELESGGRAGRLLDRRKVKKAGCSVRRFKARGRGEGQQDGTWELIAYVETNDNGEFEFNFLPPGTYRFNIEYPGIPMDEDSFVEFEIGGDGFGANDFKLEAFITANGIEVTRVNALAIYHAGFKGLNLYPNPADDVLNISYDRLLATDYEVKIYDLKGVLIHTEKLPSGHAQHLMISVSNLEEGLYLATFQQLGTGDIAYQLKIIIKH